MARTGGCDSPLARVRKRLGLTAEQLGARLGVSGVTIHRWETGERAAPESAFIGLGVIGLAAEQAAWAARNGRKAPRLAASRRVEITLTSKLPLHVTEAEAREVCARAIGELVAKGASK